MSDRWRSPTVEHSRSPIEVKPVDEVAPASPGADGVEPVLGVSEADLNLLDAFYHQLALDASQDPRPNTPEEDEDDAWLMERARQRMSMSPAEARAQRERDRR
jgi:hypothetical protein